MPMAEEIMKRAVIVDAIRTPMGRYGGALAAVRPDDMMAHVLTAMEERHPEMRGRVDDVIVGCANQAGEDGRNVARMALLAAGYPVETPGQTVNRLCASSMQAAATGAMTIQTGVADVILAGGVESMSRAPFVFSKSERAYQGGALTAFDTALGWRFLNPRITDKVRPLSMGETAEEIFQRFAISREEQDRFAVGSHRKSLAAWKSGAFDQAVVPISVKAGSSMSVVKHDEGPREDTSEDILAKLKPAFRKEGTVTAGNSCPMSDGASLLLMMSQERAQEFGHREAFALKGYAVTALHPDVMGLGPVEACRLVLRRTGLSFSDIDLIEINEAFAVQVLACLRELSIPEDRVNVNGGAIALGHPLGCSGARIIGTLVHEMKRRQARWGLATMCVGLGQGMATVWERVLL